MESLSNHPNTVAVVVLDAARGPYDYAVPDGMTVRPGDVVRVPFGRRVATGVVWGAGRGGVAPDKLKPIQDIIPLGPDAPGGLSAPLLKLLQFVADYTVADPSAVLRLALPVDPGDPTPKTTRATPAVPGQNPQPSAHPPMLTSAQDDAAAVLVASVRQGGFAATVLDGVTGSGKTEVYTEAIAAALSAGHQVLVMVPEIALTQALLARLQKRFGDAPAAWHSHLTPARRRATFQGIVSGRVRLVVGARSALMLPYPHLGLVVIDEEHDASYKQEDGVMYHARDMAVARARFEERPIILASATPSLETMANVASGRYARVALPHRFGGAVMPVIHTINLKDHPPERGQFLSPRLVVAMQETVTRGEQVLLFLNRRGYAPLTLCRACGHRFNCPRCTAWMVAHRRSGHLHCHHCGYEMRLPKNCPACNEENSTVACGPGVERIEEEVKVHLPTARTLVLSSDLQDDPKVLAAALQDIEQRRVDVVVGTQLIAKGHHFPGLTLVGVVDADLGLSGGDLRASERTFQLLQQVAGRAGRAEQAGTVYLQTFYPDHKVIAALVNGDRDDFMAIEGAERQAAMMPPYGRLAGVILSSKDESAVRAYAQSLARAVPNNTPLKFWGPAEAPMYRLRGRYRMRFLVQGPKNVLLQEPIAVWVAGVPSPRSVEVRIDIDPQSFY